MIMITRKRGATRSGKRKPLTLSNDTRVPGTIKFWSPEDQKVYTIRLESVEEGIALQSVVQRAYSEIEEPVKEPAAP